MRPAANHLLLKILQIFAWTSGIAKTANHLAISVKPSPGGGVV